MANRINYQVGFDIQKSGLNQLKASLQQLSKMSFNDLMKINHSDRDAAIEDLKSIKAQAANVENALKKAFNPKLETINIETFNKQLEGAGSSIDKVYSSFSKAGAVGEGAFRNLSSQVLSTNVQLKEAHTLLDNMATTLANTIKWNVASSAINALSGSVQQAFGYVKSLDTSLNDIRIVTNKTAEDMDVFAEKANKVAQSLGKTTTDYTEAALIYAQQGLSDKEIQERAKITLETANVTGQSTDEVSQQLTAVWNGYKVSADEAQVYVDRLAAVAATTASDLEELSTGMSKVASAANLMGVGEDQLAAMLSTVISVTREAPETVGSALKTIFARINDIKAGVAEDGATLGRFSSQMADYGFNVLDANGHLRDMGDVLEEIGGKWDTLGREQQVALSQIMGGKYQYSRLLSLFDNFDQYNKALETAREAEGTLQEQQDIYMESTAAHLNTLKASVENIFDSFLNTDSINGVVDALSGAANIAASFVDSIGGGGQILKDLGAIGVTVFSNQIAKSINTTITNFETAKHNAEQLKAGLAAVQEWKGIPGLDEVSQSLIQDRQNLFKLAKSMSPEQFNNLQRAINEATQSTNKYTSAVEKVKQAKKAFNISDQVLESKKAQQESLLQIDKQIQEYQKLSQVINQTRNGIKLETDDDFTIAKEKLEAYINEIEQLNSGDLNSSITDHETKIIELKELVSSLPNSIGESQEDDINKIGEAFDAIDQATQKSVSNIRDESKKLEDAYKEMGDASFQAEQKGKRVAEGLNNAFRALKIEDITKIAGGIAQVGMSIEQLQNLGSIWRDDDISTGQKILQTVTNLAMTLPMLVSGLATLSSALGLVTIQTGEAAVAAVASGQAFEFLGMAISINPFTAWIAGAAALVGGLAILNSALKQNREEIIETQKAKIDEQNQKQEQIKSNQQLYDSLEQLDQKYKDGEISRTDLKSSVQDLVDQYGLQDQAAKKLKDSYLDLSSAIKDAREESEQELIQSTRREKSAARNSFRESLKGSGGIADSLFGDYSKVTFGSGGVTKEVEDQISKIFSSKGANVSDNGVITYDIDFNTASGEELIQLYENIQTAVDKLEDSSKIDQKDLDKATQYQRATEFLKEFSDQYKALKEAAEETDKALNDSRINNIAQSVNLENIKDTNDYLEKRTDLIEKLKDSYRMTYDEAATVVDEYLQKNHDEIYNQFSEISDNLDKFKEKIGGEIPENIENLVNKLDDQQLTKFFELDPENFQSWQDLESTLDEISQKDFSNVADINAMKESAAQDFTYFSSLQDQVSSGKNISNKQFESLAERGAEQLQEFFDMAANGTYKMTGDAEEFYRLVDDFKLDGFYETLDAIQQKIRDINEAGTEFGYNEQFSSVATTFGGMDQDVAGPMLVVDQEKLSAQIEYLESAKAITEEQAEIWSNLVENHEADVDLCEQIAEKVAQTGNQSANLKEQWWQIQEQIHDALVPLDEDIDTEVLDRLAEKYAESAGSIQGLNDAMQGNMEWAESAAASILRFDDGIQDVIDHYEEWIDVLNSGSELEFVQIADDLADAYADILDLANNDMLSDKFLQSADNLQLLRIAAGDSEGSIEDITAAAEDAYNQLMELAQQDIEANLTIYDDEFYTKKQQIEDALSEWQAEGFNEIQIDANLQNADFINSFNEMLQMTDAGVAEAESLLQAMGFDAEVIETEPQVIDTPTENQYWKPATYHTETMSTGGQQNQGSYAKLVMDEPGQWVSEPGSTTTVIPGTGAVQIKSLHNTTGGNIKFSKSSNGGGSLGTKRRQAIAQKKQAEADKAAEQTRREQEKLARQQEQERQKAEREAQKQRRAEQQAAKKAQQQQERAAKKAQQEQQKAAKQAQRNAQKAAKAAQQNIDTSQKDEKDLLEDNRDLYHDINIQIKQIDRNLERVQKRQDRLYGKNLLDNLNKQTEILEKHKKKLKEKQQIQQYDIDLQRKSLESLGAAFDQYGNISNYMDLIAKKQNLVNSLIQQYNVIVNNFNASTDKEYKKTLSEQMDRINRQITQAQKELKDTQTKVKNYDSVRDAMEDITDQIEEQTQKQIEINISKFRMQLEIRLDMGEAQRDWNEFERKVINHTDVIKDSDLSALFRDAQTDVSDINSYFDVYGEKGSIQMLTEQLLNTHDQILAMQNTGWSPIYGDNEKQALEDFKGDLNQLMDQMIKLNDYVDSIDQAYLKTIDLTQAKFNQHMKDYQFVDGLIQHDMDLLKLLYGDKNYAAMDKYYQKKKENSLQSIDFLTREVNYWKQMWDNAEGEQDAKKFKENYEKALQEQRKAIEDHGKLLQNTLSNAIKGAFQELEDKLTDNKGFEYLDLEWDLMNMNEEGYLDDINASFAIQDLENQFKKALRSRAALNDADVKNIKAQQQIKKLMDEQLANLKEKEKVTQYDVDRVQKLLEIEQARIALEDARANKTTMQLRRDSQGNYSYEYVADQDGIQEAQDNLAKVQNDLYNFDKDKYKSNLEDILAAWKDYQEKYEEIKTDMNINDQQRMERLALLDQEYGEYMNNLHKQNADIRNNLEDSAFGELASLYDTDVTNYKEMSQKEKEILLGDLVPEWDSGIQKMADKFAGEGGFIPTCEDAFIRISEATQDYEKDLDQMATTAEFDLGSLKDGVDDAIDSYSELIDNNEELIEVWKRAIDTITEMKTQAHYLVSEFNAVYQSAMQAVKGMSAFYDAQQAKAAAEAAQYSSGAVDPTPTYSDNDDSSAYIDFSGGGGDGDPNVGDVVTFEGQYYHDSWGQAPAGSKYAGVEGGVIIDDYSSVDYGGRATKTGDYDVHIKSADGRYPDLGWIRLSQLRGYATGGYTGNWAGPEGRIGILHQKEMVLNANDTKNILDSVGILRNLMDNAGINMFARLNGLRSDSYNPFSNNESFEQNVHIDATFPNVDSKREIEQAFNDLVNLAAQRAMRR